MKKILIVNKSLCIGGIQTALKNMLSELSNEDVLIDLLLFNKIDCVENTLPGNVNLLDCSLLVQTMGMTFSDAKKTKNILQIAFKIFSSVWSRLFGNILPINIAFAFQKKLVGYDYAIAYHQEVRPSTMINGFNRFIIKKVDAKEKIGWIHTDVEQTKLNTDYHHKIYSQLDKLVTVSKGTRASFVKSFPQFSDKTYVVHNFHQLQRILDLSKLDPVVYEKDRINILTVARIGKEKGHWRMPDILKRLKNDGYNFCWHVVGGTDPHIEQDYKELIEKCGLSDNVRLYSFQKNPYRFFPNADLLLAPSYNEAAPMVFSEAECLSLPILATRTSSADEMISERGIGIVCDNDDNAIYVALKKILDDPDCLKIYRDNCDVKSFYEMSKEEFFNVIKL